MNIAHSRETSPQIIHRLETRAVCSSLVRQAVGVLSLSCFPPTGVRGFTCSLLDWIGLVAAELGATLLCCVSAPNCNDSKQIKTR